MLQKHDFSEETLDLVTEISLNLLDSQSTGKGLRKDQSLSFQLELFHYSWMWHNYKRCWMWNLIRIIWHSSLLKKSLQLLLWSPKCDRSTEYKSTCKWPLLGMSLASLGHFVTFHKYQEYGKTENVAPNIVPFSSVKQFRKHKKQQNQRGAYLLAHVYLMQPNSFRRAHFNQKWSFALLCKSAYVLICLYNLTLIYYSPVLMPVNGLADRNSCYWGWLRKSIMTPKMK